MCQFMKALLSIHGAEREFMAKPIHAESLKTAILRCIMRKASYRPTEAYLAYVRVGYKRLDKIRR